MLKRYPTVILAVLAVLVGGTAAKAAPWGDYLVACGDEDLYVIHAATSTAGVPDILWHWNVFESYGQVPDEVRQHFRTLDDCKPVDDGKHLLLTSSSGGTLLLDIATKDCLFYAVTPMAHSAEALPGGRIAVANSIHPEGNSLELYDRSASDVCLWRDTLYSGHGVVWSEKYERLFVLGFDELRRYALKDWDSASPSLELEMSWTLPGNSGHDLFRAGEDKLTVTNHAGAYLFDMASGSFHPFPSLKKTKGVKSLNHDPQSRKTIYTKGETSWWTNHIYLQKPDKVLTFDPAFRLYKVRVLPDWDPEWTCIPERRCDGSDLRIFDDNIWQYDSEQVPEKWIPLHTDPRDSVRSIGFAKLVSDYKPDIVTLQEYSSHMDRYLAPKLSALGLTNACEKDESWNFTPVFYDSTAVELLRVNYHLYKPAQFSNSNTKSYTSAVFRHRGTGKVFAVINTHLWYKSDKTQPGSMMARAAQVRLMMAEAEIIKSQYGCTVFMMGDMNCEEKTVPIRQLLEEGYTPCYKAAKVSGDRQNGHHRCSAAGFSEVSDRKGPDRETGALDHFFIHNAPAATEVLVYYCITDKYTLPLTDHYPNYVDVKL